MMPARCLALIVVCAGALAAHAQEAPPLTPASDTARAPWLVAVDAGNAVAAVAAVAEAGPDAFVPLGERLRAENPAVVWAASRALEALWRSVPEAEQDAAATALTRVAEALAVFPCDAPAHPAAHLRCSAKTAIVQQLGQWQAETAVSTLREHVAHATGGAEAAEALARIRTESAQQALIALLTGDDIDRATRAAWALSTVRRDAVPPALASAVEGATGELRTAIGEAGSRLGVPLPNLYTLPPDAAESERLAYSRGGMRAALVALHRGDRRTARQNLRYFADSAARRYQIRAALAGLARMNHAEAPRLAIGYLTAHQVRPTAMRLLSAWAGAEFEDQLRQAYAVTDPVRQAALLEVLQQRGAQDLAPLFAEAEQSEHTELRSAARWLQGQPVPEADLLALLKTGLPWTRRPAAESYLAAVRGHFDAGRMDVARAMYGALLHPDIPLPLQRAGLAGLGRTGGETPENRLRAALDEPELRITAHAALARLLAEAGRTEAAATLAREARGIEAAHAVGEALATEEVELSTDIAARWGYVTAWQIVGPFPNPRGQAFGRPFLDERRGPRAGDVDFLGETYAWRPATASGLPAWLVFEEGATPQVYYAATEVAVEEVAAATLHLGATGGVELVYAGAPVYARATAFTGTPGEVRVPVVLSPGRNQILVKLLTTGAPGRLALRLTTRQDEAIDLNQQQLPEDGLDGVGVSGDTLLRSLENIEP